MIAQVLSVLGFGERADVANTQDKLTVLKARGPKLEAATAAAAAALGATQAAVSEAQAKLNEAESAYADAPGEQCGKLVREAREALELARLRTRKPQAAAEAAGRAVDAWRVEIAATESERDQAKRAEHLVELRERATLEDFEARAAAPRERLRAALAEVSAAAGEVTELWHDATGAAHELSAAGEPTDPIAEFHLVAPFVLAEAQAHPEAAGGLLGKLGEFAWPYRVSRGWGKPSGLDLSAAVRGPLFGELAEKRGETRPDLKAIVMKQLRAALAAPTLEQARAAVASFNTELREASAEKDVAAKALSRHERRHGDANESEDESRGVAASDDGIMTRVRRSLTNSLSERRDAAGEHDPMSRTRAHLSATAADGHFAAIAPPPDHFKRLNS